MQTVEKEEKEETPEERERQKRIQDMPLLEQCYNLMDFEAVARRIMKRTAWGYYSSAADDEIVSFFDTLRREEEIGPGGGVCLAAPCHKFANQTHRPCARTTPPSIEYGSDRKSSLTSRRSISRPLCWAPRSTSPST